MSLDRARIYLENDRYQEAAAQCRAALATEPEDAEARAMLAVCLLELGQKQEALVEAKRAVASDPEDSYPHAVLSSVFFAMNKVKDARTEAVAALNIEPENASYYGLLGQVLVREKNWNGALQAAEQGLRFDPEHEHCAHIRGLALGHLGRKDEANAFIRKQLQDDPDSATAHATLGWNELQRKRPKEALHHFQSALKIDSNFEWAREGLIEALRSRYWIYRVLLGFRFWIHKFPTGTQYAIIFGFVIGFRALRSVTRDNPALWPYVLPVIVAYSIFAFMFWTVNPLFNLTLLLHPLGKLALTRDERKYSLIFGLTLAWGFAAIALMLALRAPYLIFGAIIAFIGCTLFSWLELVKEMPVKLVLALLLFLGVTATNVWLLVEGVMNGAFGR